ncbi:unnamed protein product [Amoebophrya sp. A25]|nr:unnamed protein product [Amoebophrya sp. A25]|eukprot:GSA25T00023440001.1
MLGGRCTRNDLNRRVKKVAVLLVTTSTAVLSYNTHAADDVTGPMAPRGEDGRADKNDFAFSSRNTTRQTPLLRGTSAFLQPSLGASSNGNLRENMREWIEYEKCPNVCKRRGTNREQCEDSKPSEKCTCYLDVSSQTQCKDRSCDEKCSRSSHRGVDHCFRQEAKDCFCQWEKPKTDGTMLYRSPKRCVGYETEASCETICGADSACPLARGGCCCSWDEKNKMCLVKKCDPDRPDTRASAWSLPRFGSVARIMTDLFRTKQENDTPPAAVQEAPPK